MAFRWSCLYGVHRNVHRNDSRYDDGDEVVWMVMMVIQLKVTVVMVAWMVVMVIG